MGTGSEIKARAICVLGMHRSGTSAVTRALNILGAYIGEEKDMIAPGFDNPGGFWELSDIVVLHKRIMTALRRGEDEIVSPLPPGWYLREEMIVFRKDLQTLIQKHFAGRSLWAWKDPRTCLTFDLWKNLLHELGVELSVLFVVRNPLDVANSLKKRNGYAFDKSFGIWFNHNISALESIAGIRTVFINYDRFLEAWEVELRRVAFGLGLPWLNDDRQLKKKIKSFIRTDFRHNTSTAEDLQHAPAPVRELYCFLDRQTTGMSVREEFGQLVGELARSFRVYASFFITDLESSFEREKKLIELIRAKDALIRVKDEKISEYERQLIRKVES